MDVWVVWLIIAGILLIAEMMSFTFYMLWLAIGALAGLVVALVVPESSLLFQVIVAAAVAVLLTIFTKPLTHKLRKSRGFQDAVDQLIGKKGIVTEPIEHGQMGIVRVDSEYWSATASATLKRDAEVRVLRRSSTILEVEPWGGDS
ncbi:NfeD family protein [Paenibacillus guangzhouensis]|uniref:NfeD family protein n=1 Tax=Paenibacillus guangzhouensis TaxID=1473112 RepID=UPI001266A68F|nr:NfeD family protein [Paenibacillus guangzhouensis]